MLILFQGSAMQNREQGYMRHSQKLDGVGPGDNRPSTGYLHLFVQEKKKYVYLVTCDILHVTCDM